MVRVLAETIDRIIIRSATRHLLARCELAPGQWDEAGLALARQRLEALSPASIKVKTLPAGAFEFDSPLTTRWPENNLVPGRWFHCKKSPAHAAIILIHGWNAELGYDYLFPLWAWRLNQLQLDVVMFELPFHGRRKPPAQPGVRRNWISAGLADTLESALQAVMEIQALTFWVRQQLRVPVGLWGVSLGAWLAGLTCCLNDPPEFALLMTPIVRMDQAIQDLAFCEPLRRALAGRTVPMDAFDLCAHTCRLHPSQVLLLAAKYDQFVPLDSAEKLCRAWGNTDLWRIPHGHISAMISPVAAERAIRWLARQSCEPRHLCG